MGKKTLFHPISINVIRGSTEICGFTLGKISQTNISMDQMSARYRVVIQAAPENFFARSQDDQKIIFQGCFMDDIQVTWIGKNTNGDVIANLLIALSPEDQEKMMRWNN